MNRLPAFQGHVENGMVVVDQPLPLPDGTPVRIDAITPAMIDFWKPCSLAELVARQAVAVPESVEVLFGGWRADEPNDDFEINLMACRNREPADGEE